MIVHQQANPVFRVPVYVFCVSVSRLVVFLFFQSAWCVVYDRSVFGIRSTAWCCLSWIFFVEKLYVRPVDKLSRLTLYCSVFRAHR